MKLHLVIVGYFSFKSHANYLQFFYLLIRQADMSGSCDEDSTRIGKKRAIEGLALLASHTTGDTRALLGLRALQASSLCVASNFLI